MFVYCIFITSLTVWWANSHFHIQSIPPKNLSSHIWLISSGGPVTWKGIHSFNALNEFPSSFQSRRIHTINPTRSSFVTNLLRNRNGWAKTFSAHSALEVFCVLNKRHGRAASKTKPQFTSYSLQRQCENYPLMHTQTRPHTNDFAGNWWWWTERMHHLCVIIIIQTSPRFFFLLS